MILSLPVIVLNTLFLLTIAGVRLLCLLSPGHLKRAWAETHLGSVFCVSWINEKHLTNEKYKSSHLHYSSLETGYNLTRFALCPALTISQMCFTTRGGLSFSSVCLYLFIQLNQFWTKFVFLKRCFNVVMAKFLLDWIETTGIIIQAMSKCWKSLLTTERMSLMISHVEIFSIAMFGLRNKLNQSPTILWRKLS